MASPSQPKKNAAAPSAAWLLCAACGPLNGRHAALTGLLFDEEGIVYAQRCYEVEQPVPYNTLRAWVEASPEVQAALDVVESARSRASRRDSPPPSYPELAGRARAALLQGKGKLFNSCFEAYAREHVYSWHPDRSHGLFWESVLGQGWEGAEALPEGDARCELAFFAGNVFAFCACPRGLAGLPAASPMLEAAAALRGADAAALQKLAAGGSPAAGASLHLLAGGWTEAHRAFSLLFGRSGDAAYALEQQGAMPLLAYALTHAVLSGGKATYVRAWFGYLRGMVQGVFPETVEKPQGVLMRFLDHLEMVDALLNRGQTVLPPPRSKGPLSLLPFAMAYSALPQYLRLKLPADRLAAAVESLAKDGLKLLAAYGAAGLLHAGGEGLEQAGRQRLQALADGVGAALPPAYAPPSVRVLSELQGALERQGRASLREYGLESPRIDVSRVEGGALINLREWSVADADDPPALRCLQKHATRGLVLLEGASPAALSRLCLAMLPQVEAEGSLAAPGEEPGAAQPQPVLCVAGGKDGRFAAAFRLRLLPGALPFFVPGCGLHEPVLLHGGQECALRRDLKAELQLQGTLLAALRKAGVLPAARFCPASVELEGFDELAALLAWCRSQGMEACWEKGPRFRLHRPQGGLSLSGEGGAGAWLELGYGLPADERRVLELTELLAAYAQREGDILRIGEGGGEYVLLNDCLLRQLALLELTSEEKKGKKVLCPAALPLLKALAEPTTSSPAATLPPTPLPEGLRATLRPYQQAGFTWLAERAQQGLGAILADDMGLGKTVQMLALLLQQAAQGASLVAAPLSLLGNWAAEAARFAPLLRVTCCDARTTPDELDSAQAGTLVLVSYGQLASRLDTFASRTWNLLVLDEAQAIKNPDSQRARAVCALNARARFCLTGTPIENSLLDLWSQMRFLNAGLLGTRAAFMRRFGKGGEEGRELLRRVLAPLVLRRHKKDVLAQLPPLTEMVEWVEFSDEERSLYESLRRKAAGKLEAEGEAGSKRIGILAELTKMRRACCHGKLALPGFAGESAKLDALGSLVADLRAAGHRTLVFSQFTDVLDLAQEALQGQGASCLRLDGSTPAAQRSGLVGQFQQGGADVFLISLKAGGAGLNLTAADYVILLDPWWNPAVEAQAAARSHRMGQAQPVTLCRLIVRDTLEERILELHQGKQELAESILSGTGEAMSLDQLRTLLG